jgi:topoisomerase IV subunit A
VLEPRSRTVDPVLLMESLFRLTDLEIALSLNMNVLARGRVPMVLSLARVLRQWLDHRKEVLVGARAIAWPRSRGGWRCWAAT